MLEEELIVAKTAAMQAGQIACRYFGKHFFVKKKGKIDLVTQADFECEKKIHSVLSKRFPADHFLGEESGLKEGQSDRVWIIDPIDGTINFAHGIACFSSSIGLMKNGKVIVGVAFNPLTKEMFYAVKGKGAFLNGKKIKTSKKKQLIDCVIATGFPYERGLIAKKTIQSMSNLVQETQGLRRFGSAVLDLCLVARGAFDGFFEYRLFPWDVSAACLIVEEAGGKVTDFFGKKTTPFSSSFVASNSLIHAKLLSKLVKP